MNCKFTISRSGPSGRGKARNSRMRTAFFGGTFDPVHRGHLAIAQAVLDRGLADRVLFVPAPTPPHKTDQPVTPFEQRFAMLALALEGHKNFGLSDMERHRTGKSYTIDSLEALSADANRGETLLLIGADSLCQLHTWKRPHDLVKSYRLITYPRYGEIPEPARLRPFWNEEEIARMLASVIPDAPHFPVSSTEIREMLKKGDLESASAFVTGRIMEYITDQHLYGTGGTENFPAPTVNKEKRKTGRTEEFMANEKKIEAEDIVKLCEEIAYDRKAENIIRIDLKELPAVTDYFLLCTASSEPHIRAIVERIQRDVLEKLKVKPLHVDGSPESRWSIVDFGSVMVHVMTEESRTRYQLEDLWGDAPKTDAVKRIEAALRRRAVSTKEKEAAK